MSAVKRRLPALVLSLALLWLCGCAKAPEAQKAPDDNVRSWYEVFVRSYADSDGDGIGDLAGLTGKLDYIRSLGCRGIWLMPVMPSPSYHKYDVTDYYDVDPAYGTLDDMRTLLREAHARDMRVIIDLPLNHTSDRHRWFQSAVKGGGAPWREYYNWIDGPREGFAEQNGNWYECRFVDSMPDLNLDCPALRQEIGNILRFWLTGVGVDGFRLDAVTSFYTGDTQKNIDFLDWLADTARKADPDCYLVAEAWTDLETIARYSESGVDSCFLFPAAQAGGWIDSTLSRREGAGVAWAEALGTMSSVLPEDTIPAPFLENHDTDRAVTFTGRNDPARTKMAGGLLCLLPGNVFLYYGQEIGLSGSGEDPNRRIGMLWTSPDETTTPPPGTTWAKYVYPSAAEQERHADSILNYYRSALSLRERYPAIARGRAEPLPCGDPNLCLARYVWGEESVLVCVNPSRQEGRCAVPKGWHTADTLLADGGRVRLRGRTLRMCPGSIAVLTGGE